MSKVALVLVLVAVEEGRSKQVAHIAVYEMYGWKVRIWHVQELLLVFQIPHNTAPHLSVLEVRVRMMLVAELLHEVVLSSTFR